MKYNIYKPTNRGLERVNDKSLTAEEAWAIMQTNLNYIARDASVNYQVTELEEWQEECVDFRPTEFAELRQDMDSLTAKEREISANFRFGIKISLAMGAILFIIQIILP